MNRTNYIHYCIAMLVSCLLLNACVKDDDECPTVARFPYLTFAFDFEAATVPCTLSPDDVRTACLYIFDKKERRFVASWVFEDFKFNEPNRVGVAIPPGNYEFAVWFYKEKSFLTKPSLSGFQADKPEKKDAWLELDISCNQEDDLSAPWLFYGQVADAEIKAIGDNTFVAPVVLNTRLIRLTAKGRSKNADTYRFIVTDDNGAYDFDNAFAPFRQFDYRAATTFLPTSPDLHASLNMLRLDAGRRPLISLRNLTTGDVLYPSMPEHSNNLVDLILAKYPGIDFEQHYVFDIILYFEAGRSISVDVSVWGRSEDDYEIYPE